MSGNEANYDIFLNTFALMYNENVLFHSHIPISINSISILKGATRISVNDVYNTALFPTNFHAIQNAIRLLITI